MKSKADAITFFKIKNAGDKSTQYIVQTANADHCYIVDKTDYFGWVQVKKMHWNYNKPTEIAGVFDSLEEAQNHERELNQGIVGHDDVDWAIYQFASHYDFNDTYYMNRKSYITEDGRFRCAYDW